MAVSVKFQNVYRIVVDDTNNVMSLPVSVVVDFSDLQVLTNVVKIQIFLLQRLLPYPDDNDNVETIHKSWYITPEEFNLLLEKMFLPYVEGTQFENVFTSITKLINMSKVTCADYLSDFHTAYSMVFFDYNAKRPEVCKILTQLRQWLKQKDASTVGFHELQYLSMMLQRFVTLMRKPYAIYAAIVVILLHMPLLMGYPSIRVECASSELNHITLIDVVVNAVLISVREALTEDVDEFLRFFINHKLNYVHDLDSLHYWYKHLLLIDRNCVKKYILSIEKYLTNQQKVPISNSDDFLTTDGDDVSFNENGWRILGLLSREDRPFMLMQKRVLESINISMSSYFSIWFTTHSMLLHLPQHSVSNMSYTVNIRRAIRRICKMTGYHINNTRNARFDCLTLYKFINEITNTIINMRLFTKADVYELINVYNRHPVVVEILQYLLELSPKSIGKLWSSEGSSKMTVRKR